MTPRKIQIEVLKWDRPSFFIYEDRVFFCDGYIALAVNASDLILDLSKLRKIDVPSIMKNKQGPIADTRICMFDTRSTIRKFSAGSFNVYINNSFLKYFDGSTFYSGPTPLDAVYAERLGVTVGIICPIRVTKEF